MRLFFSDKLSMGNIKELDNTKKRNPLVKQNITYFKKFQFDEKKLNQNSIVLEALTSLNYLNKHNYPISHCFEKICKLNNIKSSPFKEILKNNQIRSTTSLSSNNPSEIVPPEVKKITLYKKTILNVDSVFKSNLEINPHHSILPGLEKPKCSNKQNGMITAFSASSHKGLIR